jgi:hypothetical protein
MKRFSFVFIPALSAVLLSLTGCDQSGSKVCVDQDNRVVDDDSCLGSHHWRYYGHGSATPAIGSFAAGGSSEPAAGESYGVSRGGFGEGGEGHGGGFGE